MRTCYSATLAASEFVWSHLVKFKSPLLCLHLGTGTLLFGLGFAKITHGHAVPDHDTTELLLYIAYVRLNQNCSSYAHAAFLVAQFVTIVETVMVLPSHARLNKLLIRSRHISGSPILLFSFVPKAKWHKCHPSTSSLDKLKAWNSRKKTGISNCFYTSLHRSLLRLAAFQRQKLLG